MPLPLCPVCQKEESNYDPILKILPGTNCQNRRLGQNLPDSQVEFTGAKIKEERREYAKSIIQPFRSGELSKEYLDAWGTKGINPTSGQIKKARNVWSEDVSPNFDLKKSK